MKPRMNYYQAAPDTIKALVALEAQIQASGLEKSLIELVKTRASQINGCAYCINMHTQDARKQGETEQRLYSAERLARVAAVYRPRTRGFGLDRRADADCRNACPRRSLRRRARPLLGIGDRQSDHADRGYQCLEQAGHRFSRGAPGKSKSGGGVNNKGRTP